MDKLYFDLVYFWRCLFGLRWHWVVDGTSKSNYLLTYLLTFIFTYVLTHLLTATTATTLRASSLGPRWLTFTWWGCCGLCQRHKPTELAHSFLFCSCVCFCLYGPFNCISFHKFSRQLSDFSLCSSGLDSALLVLSTIYLFIKVSLSPDIILCGWPGSRHQLTN